MFSIQDKVISLRTQVDCCWLAKQDEREAIAIFFSIDSKELVRIDSIRDGASDKWNEMKDDRWFVGGGEEELSDDVLSDEEDDECDECCEN